MQYETMATELSDEETDYSKVEHQFLHYDYGYVQKSTTRGPVSNKSKLWQNVRKKQSSLNVLVNEKTHSKHAQRTRTVQLLRYDVYTVLVGY